MLKDRLTNMRPVFNGNKRDLNVRARKLDEESQEEGLEKIKQIESNIRDSILHEV